MKTITSITTILLLASLILVLGCKSKKEMNDPTQLELNLLVELNKGVSPDRLKSELKQFDFGKHKASNKTLNQHVYSVTLNGQSADELLRAVNTKDYVKSAKIAQEGNTSSQNMPTGKSTKTSPIKG